MNSQEKKQQRFEIDFNHILGQGSFSTVYNCKDLQQNKEVVAKVFYLLSLKNKRDYDYKKNQFIDFTYIPKKERHFFQIIKKNEQYKEFIPEIYDIQKIQHKYIFYLEKSYLGQVMNFDCNDIKYIKSDLLQKIQKEEEKKVYLNIFLQMTKALQFLHNQYIGHRDIKIENFLIFGDMENFSIKLIDFNTFFLCYEDDQYYKCDKGYGTYFYQPPESLHSLEKGYDILKADTWALGVCFYIILTCKIPFQSEDMDLQHQLAYEISIQNNEPDYKGIDNAQKQLLQKMLYKNPEERYDINYVFDYLSKININ